MICPTNDVESQTLNEAIFVANPGLSQFPENTDFDCYARGIREMQYYQGKIYIGYGHWGYGGYSGKYVSVKVWSIDAHDYIKAEITTKDETAYPIFMEDGKLFVSPGDTLANEGAYIFKLENGVWQSALVPGVNKGRLEGFFQDALYFNAGQYYDGSISDFKKSTDFGKTWEIILEDYPNQGIKLISAISFDSFLLQMGAEYESTGRGIIFKWYPDNSYEKYHLNYPISIINSYAHRLVRFQDGVLYIPNYDSGYNLFKNYFQFELLFLNDFSEGTSAMPVKGFSEDSNVVDVIVRGNTVYVFSAGQLADGYHKGYVHSSTDLNNWTKIAEFVLPGQAVPYAFELLDETNTFYIGLGSSIFNGCSDPGSGSIYKVTPDIGKPDINLTKQVSAASAKSGDEITYQILYHNTGSAEAKNLRITDVIPAGTQYVVGSANSTADFDNNTLTWTIPSLALWGSGAVSFKVKID